MRRIANANADANAQMRNSRDSDFVTAAASFPVEADCVALRAMRDESVSHKDQAGLPNSEENVTEKYGAERPTKVCANDVLLLLSYTPRQSGDTHAEALGRHQDVSDVGMRHRVHTVRSSSQFLRRGTDRFRTRRYSSAAAASQEKPCRTRHQPSRQTLTFVKFRRFGTIDVTTCPSASLSKAELTKPNAQKSWRFCLLSRQGL
jgi:hypothetical protein